MKQTINLICALLCLAIAAPASVASAESVRPSVLAGAWYPGEPNELAQLVDDLMDRAPAKAPAGPVRALVVPHAGYRFSGATAAEAYALVRGKEYRRVLVLAPSHYGRYRGLSVAEVEAYETPLGKVPLDRDAVAHLRRSSLVQAHAAAHAREHSIEIELPFLQQSLAPGWKLVPVLVGGLNDDDYAQAAALLRPLLDAQTLLVVSSDFTHYGRRFGYLPFPRDEATAAAIRELDDGAIRLIEENNRVGFLDYQRRTGITICGYRPLALLLALLPGDATVERLGYTTSGELTGDYRNSVSYQAMVVMRERPLAALEGDGAGAAQASGRIDRDELALLHRLAVMAVESAVLGYDPEREREAERLIATLPESLKRPSGAFVTLERDGQLRGCIGNIQARNPLFLAIMKNGVNAAVNDRRFRPVAADELDDLTVEVSVLTPLRPIADLEDFRVGEQGIVLSKQGRRAVFLPEVAVEQGWDREQTLSHLSKKAGLSKDAWREGARFEVFESIKYGAPYRAAPTGEN